MKVGKCVGVGGREGPYEKMKKLKEEVRGGWDPPNYGREEDG